MTELPAAHPLSFRVTPAHREVSALWNRPADARSLLVLGHGAGSTLRHRLMEELSLALAAVGVATLRFNYPYSERGRGMDPEPIRLATVRAAVAVAAAQGPGLPIFAGGHSMSGRMFSLAESREPLPGIVGLVLYSFPLHSGAPNVARAAHLAEVRRPLLFLSGTRDRMADPKLLEGVVAGLGAATLHWVDTADHGFAVLERRSSSEPVLQELARVTAEWMRPLCG